MTPEQKAALETLTGRALTPDDETALEPWLAWDVRRDDLIAAHLSAGRTAVQEYWLTDRGLVADLVVATGSTAMSDAILAHLDVVATQSRSVKAMLNRLENDSRGLNFGDPSLRAQLPYLGFSEAEVAALLALALQPAPLSVGQVSDALNIAEGRMTL